MPIYTPAKAGLVLLSAVQATNVAAVDFTALIDSSFDEYEFHVQNLVPVNDNETLRFQTSSDGGATFDSTSGDYGYANSWSSTSAPTPAGSASSSAGSVLLTPSAAVRYLANGGASGVVRLIDPAGTAVQKHIVYQFGSVLHQLTGAARRTSIAAVNACRFSLLLGDIESVKIKMYGVRKS